MCSACSGDYEQPEPIEPEAEPEADECTDELHNLLAVTWQTHFNIHLSTRSQA
jgi:hypothetical protein